MTSRRAPSRALTVSTASHCAALLVTEPNALFEGTRGRILDSATMTFVSFEGQCYGVTNSHVLQPKDVMTPFFYLALTRHSPIPGRMLVRSTESNLDAPWDVALFSIQEEVLQAAGKRPCPVPSASPIEREAMALAVGFPGAKRFEQDARHSGHPLYHVAGTCRTAAPKIIMQDIYEVEPEPSDAFRFGGMSGGPIFALREDDAYDLAGIIFQGDHRPQTTSGGAPESWIWGFPLTAETMAALLDLGPKARTPPHPLTL